MKRMRFYWWMLSIWKATRKNIFSHKSLCCCPSQLNWPPLAFKTGYVNHIPLIRATRSSFWLWHHHHHHHHSFQTTVISFLGFSAFVLGNCEARTTVKAASVGENLSSSLGSAIGWGDLPSLLHMNQTPLLRKVVATHTKDNHHRVHFKLRKESPSRTEQFSVKTFPLGSLPKD